MISNTLIALQGTLNEQRFRADELLSGHTILKVGGVAEYYIEVDKISELTKVVKAACENDITIHVIGSGSSTVFADKQIKGLVIKNNCRKFDVISRKGKIRNNEINVDRAYIYADSGVLMNQLVRFAIEQNFSGLENHLGVAGTVGGNLFRKTKENELLNEYIYQIQVIDGDGNIKIIDRDELFITDKRGISEKARYVILSVIFELFPSHKELLWDKGTKAIEKRQKEKPDNPTALYAFQDISAADAMSLPTPGYTTSPAYLIENAGLAGKKIGNLMISESYPNYIVATGDAGADEYIGIIKYAKEKIYDKYGVRLNTVCSIIEN